MMRFSPLTGRVAGKGAETWAIHRSAMRLRDAGKDVILLTVGDPDQSPPEVLIEKTVSALRGGQTRLAAGGNRIRTVGPSPKDLS